MNAKTAGQVAYEEDCARVPTYHNGAPRKTWAELGRPERDTWERNPTPKEPARCHDDGKPDDRYQLAYEWLGYSVPMLALRFCGELIGVPHGIMAARRIADEHYAKMIGG